MLVLPKSEVDRQNAEIKDGLVRLFNEEMDKCLSRNKHKESYWILGKVTFPPEFEGKVGRMFFDVCDEMPTTFVKDSFVYKVDNKRGVKHLAWRVQGDDVIFAEEIK